MHEAQFQLLDFNRSPSAASMVARSTEYLDHAKKRRTVRHFSSDPVPDEAVRNCLMTAGTAPSGANQQPWTFVWIRSDDTRRQIREAAEEEERAFYGGRAPEEWIDAVRPFGTDAEKPFLETAPVLIAVFAQSYHEEEEAKKKNYYVSESVGLACGFLISAMHHAGLATLTHTPSPMKFLNQILERPLNERPFLLLVAGHPAEECRVPVITKKSYSEIVVEA